MGPLFLCLGFLGIIGIANPVESGGIRWTPDRWKETEGRRNLFGRGHVPSAKLSQAAGSNTVEVPCQAVKLAKEKLNKMNKAKVQLPDIARCCKCDSIVKDKFRTSTKRIYLSQVVVPVVCLSFP
jgi:hypothetical protein